MLFIFMRREHANHVVQQAGISIPGQIQILVQMVIIPFIQEILLTLKSMQVVMAHCIPLQPVSPYRPDHSACSTLMEARSLFMISPIPIVRMV